MTVLTTMACTIDAQGCHVPAFEDILETLQSKYRGIYGQDIYLGNDSQDGQLLGVFAQAINDCNAATLAAFNSFSPTTAQGASLSRLVKINGLSRAISSFSSVDVQIVGDVGLPIINGFVAASDGSTSWALPPYVTIPPSGLLVTTAICTTPGAINAAAGTITRIQTITKGWNSVNNPAAASPGLPVESDPALRGRQGLSTAQPAMTIADGIVGAVLAVPGVARAAIEINDTAATDANGVPSHTFSIVADGGDAQAIANAIGVRKDPGSGTYGTTALTYYSATGIPSVIRFFRPTIVTIIGAITIKALAGYTSAIGVELLAAMAAYIKALPIGAPVYITRLYLPANLAGTTDGQYFDVTALTIARSGGSLANANITLAFNEAATSDPTQFTLTVT